MPVHLPPRWNLGGLVYCIAWSAACSVCHAQPQAGAASADSWPNWRGPASRGVVEQSRLRVAWPADPVKPRWEATIGGGWSSPVVAAGRVFITDRTDDAEHVLAFDALTGRELWKQANPVDFDPHQVGRRHGNGPKSTPVVRDDRLYALGIAGWLQCLDVRDGRVLWSVNLPAQFGEHEPLPRNKAYVNREENVIVPIGGGEGAPVPLFGYTGSLVADGDLLIVPVGGARGGTIMAFDRTSGRVVWKSLHENVSYSSPIVAELAGVRQVVAMTGPRVVGLELATGELLWSRPFQIQYDESISTPVVADDLVLVAGDGHPLTAIKITRAGKNILSRIEWENDDLASYLSSMLAQDGYVYGMNDGGEFNCVRLADGKTMWNGGKHGYYCTPVLAGGQLLCLNERGVLLVIAAEPDQFRELAKMTLSERPTWTSPAVAGNRLYIRAQDNLRCFEFGP
jgi:outer membrane protein assembly factor BamB